MIARVLSLVLIRVVVAAHHVEEGAERRAIAGLEGVPFAAGPLGGEVTLDDHRYRIDGCHLVGRGQVHHFRIGLRTGLGASDRTLAQIVDPAGLDFAEVHVVDRGEPAQQLTVGPSERVDRDAVEVVRGVWCQCVIAAYVETVVDHDEVVGDGGDVHVGTSIRSATERAGQTLTTIELTTLSCQVCFLSSQSIQR